MKLRYTHPRAAAETVTPFVVPDPPQFARAPASLPPSSIPHSSPSGQNKRGSQRTLSEPYWSLIPAGEHRYTVWFAARAIDLSGLLIFGVILHGVIAVSWMRVALRCG